MPVRYRLRRAAAGDVETLVDLELQFRGDRLARASWRHLLMRARADIWVVENAGAVIADAVVLYRRNSANARLYSAVVHPRHRRRGIAGTLMNAAERAARGQGCHSMVLEVRPDNRAAQAFYAHRGYTDGGTIADFYEDGSAALRLRKRLTRKPKAKPMTF